MSELKFYYAEDLHRGVPSQDDTPVYLCDDVKAEIDRLNAQLLAEQERVKKLVNLVERCAKINECDHAPSTARLIRESLATISPTPVVGPRQDAD